MDDQRAARGEDGKTTYVPAAMKYEDWREEFVRDGLTESAESGIMGTSKEKGGGSVDEFAQISGGISGGLDPDSTEAEHHAIRFYESVRKRSGDVESIAKNTGFATEDICRIREFIFIESHELSNGTRRFDPDYRMSQSWQRLVEGKEIQPHDMTLIRHEILEKKLMDEGMSQSEAHDIANLTYDYTREAYEYYGRNS